MASSPPPKPYPLFIPTGQRPLDPTTEPLDLIIHPPSPLEVPLAP
ncbi:hypothetical protein [Pajaroellobacter abortibovis]|nr:hypothetical protein [Pajaroellobacter abortibovis]